MTQQLESDFVQAVLVNDDSALETLSTGLPDAESFADISLHTSLEHGPGTSDAVFYYSLDNSRIGRRLKGYTDVRIQIVQESRLAESGQLGGTLAMTTQPATTFTGARDQSTIEERPTGIAEYSLSQSIDLGQASGGAASVAGTLITTSGALTPSTGLAYVANAWTSISIPLPGTFSVCAFDSSAEFQLSAASGTSSHALSANTTGAYTFASDDYVNLSSDNPVACASASRTIYSPAQDILCHLKDRLVISTAIGQTATADIFFRDGTVLVDEAIAGTAPYVNATGGSANSVDNFVRIRTTIPSSAAARSGTSTIAGVPITRLSKLFGIPAALGTDATDSFIQVCSPYMAAWRVWDAAGGLLHTGSMTRVGADQRTPCSDVWNCGAAGIAVGPGGYIQLDLPGMAIVSSPAGEVSLVGSSDPRFSECIRSDDNGDLYSIEDDGSLNGVWVRV